VTSRDPQTEWSALLIDALVSAGIRDVVLSPGSRSTPLVLAAVQNRQLRCWDVIDERSAAFFALGIAKASGRPSLALCTSGTAGANYFPAVIEAAMSWTPLVVLTADRPLELQDSGALQTIDQLKLFGDHVRGFFELGVADGDPAALKGLRRRSVQAVQSALFPVPGPVHINARARKPLEPRAARDEAERQLAGRAAELRQSPAPRVHLPRMAPSAEGMELLAERLAQAERALVVAGPGPLSQQAARPAIAELLRRSGAVLLAEATSQLRFGNEEGIDGYDLFVDSEPLLHAPGPDLVVFLGRPPQSVGIATYLAAHAGAERWVIAPHGWNDAENAASHLLFGQVEDVAPALVSSLRLAKGEPSGWQRRWIGHEQLAQEVIGRFLAGSEDLTEGSTARIVTESLPATGQLFVGNSLTSRHVDLFTQARASSCVVVSQRGVSGIDGLVSGAAGAATTGKPTTLLVGDVSFLHDIGGLWAARHAGPSLTVVVVNNGGGKIFADLPLAAWADEKMLAHFTTPHEMRFDSVAALYGLHYRRASTSEQLRRATAEPADTSQARIIEAVVPSEGLEPTRRRLRAQFEEMVVGAS
jgi:2-succinyl-5-enolpyruvyl-6-hydroxy-3-cyclohexene-1-carboxylate synthase